MPTIITNICSDNGDWCKGFKNTNFNGLPKEVYRKHWNDGQYNKISRIMGTIHIVNINENLLVINMICFDSEKNCIDDISYNKCIHCVNNIRDRLGLVN